MPVIAWYWSTLESRFHEVLRDYTVDRDAGGYPLRLVEVCQGNIEPGVGAA